MGNHHDPIFIEGSESKGIVVFIHGFMGSPRQFDKLANSVHNRGYAISALLLPGHGGSAKNFASGTFESWQTFVNAEIKRFARDYSNIWLVGHSMGGLLAINAAVEYSGHIRGILTIATPFKLIAFSSNAARVRIKNFTAKKSSPVKAAYLSGNSIKLSPSLLWCVIKPAVELIKLIHAAKDNLSSICAPLTAVYSISDELTSIESLKILKSGLTGAPFNQLILTDSLHGYYPQHEQALIEQELTKLITTDDMDGE